MGLETVRRDIYDRTPAGLPPSEPPQDRWRAQAPFSMDTTTARPAELTAWMDLDPVPALLLGANATVIDANRAGRQFVEAGSAATLRGRTLTFSDNKAQQAFQRALALVLSNRALSKTVIVRGNDGWWRQLQILSAGAQAERAFVRLPTEPNGEVEVEPLTEAFGLSPSEGEVLRRLTAGLSPKEIARSLSISTNTVRAHLRMLYLKMNVRGIPGLIRQAVRLAR